MTKHRFTRTTALALAIGALMVPTASASFDYRGADARGSEQSSAYTPPQDLRSPDARDSGTASKATPQVAQDLRSSDTRDFAAGRQIPEVTVVRVAEPSSAPSSGLDWGDAGIGAGFLLGLILLGVGTTQVVMHRRRQPGIAS